MRRHRSRGRRLHPRNAFVTDLHIALALRSCAQRSGERTAVGGPASISGLADSGRIILLRKRLLKRASKRANALRKGHMKIQLYFLTMLLGVVLAVHLSMNGKVGVALNN